MADSTLFPRVGSSLIHRINYWSLTCAQNPALSNTATGATWTYEQLWQEIQQCSSFFSYLVLEEKKERTREEQKNFLLLSDDTPEAYITALGVIASGHVVAIVSADSPVATIEKCREHIDAEAVLIPDSCSYKEEERHSFLFSELRKNRSEYLPVKEEESEEKPAVMLFTSGTTGTPKAVMLAQRSFYAIADQLRIHNLSWIEWHTQWRTYTPLPAAHIGGLWWIFTGLSAGSHCITGSDYSRTMSQIVSDWGINSLCCVPTIMNRLATELGYSSGVSALPHLRLVVYGGSRAQEQDVDIIESHGARTAQIYGLSETGCTAVCLPTSPDSLKRIAAAQVGRPYPGVELFIAQASHEIPPRMSSDPSTDRCEGKDHAYGEGTLWIHTPAAMLGYYKDPQKTATTLVNGWINTGDRVQRSEDGFISLIGRASELIICGGANVIPDDVDALARGISYVKDAACFEIPHTVMGAVVGLAVVTDREPNRATKKDIGQFFRNQVEKEACPVEIIFVSEIPRTASGKIQRYKLQEQFCGE